MSYNIIFTKKALSAKQKLKNSRLTDKVLQLIQILENNPFQNPPRYEKLLSLENTYSRRINIQHRLVYQVNESTKTIKIISMWTHYEY